MLSKKVVLSNEENQIASDIYGYMISEAAWALL